MNFGAAPAHSMRLNATIEPAEDLELYLAYSRPRARHAAFADIRRRLASVAPHFDFDRAVTDPHNCILAVRDAAANVCGMAVMAEDNRLRLYYAGDTASTQCLMGYIEGENAHGKPASNS